jgi:hypothetical protein
MEEMADSGVLRGTLRTVEHPGPIPRSNSDNKTWSWFGKDFVNRQLHRMARSTDAQHKPGFTPAAWAVYKHPTQIRSIYVVREPEQPGRSPLQTSRTPLKGILKPPSTDVRKTLGAWASDEARLAELREQNPSEGDTQTDSVKHQVHKVSPAGFRLALPDKSR